MPSQLIHKAAELMREQAQAYGRLDSTAKQLTGALVGGTPETIESLVRVGESELLRMRSRLGQIVATLTAFSNARTATQSSDTHAPSLDPQARAAFEFASSELTAAARHFERTRALASSLSLSGSSFAVAYIETCGVPPTTYRAPYSNNRYGAEGAKWA